VFYMVINELARLPQCVKNEKV